MKQVKTIVVGAGISGLRCALELHRQGHDFLLIESEDGVGGKMRTDVIDGFRLDRGFHVLQTAYPEAAGVVDFEQLELRTLEPGAIIRYRERWVRMSDPWRRPQHAWRTLFNPIGTITDRWKLMRLRSDALASPDLPAAAGIGVDCKDVSTLELLQQHYGFSKSFVEHFLRPWWAGVFLESQLHTSASFMRFVFKMLSSGLIAYPSRGIQSVPDQLANQLPGGSVQTGATVEAIDCGFSRDAAVDSGEVHVLLASGEKVSGKQLVLAVPMHVSEKLLGRTDSSKHSASKWNAAYTQTSCLYFRAAKPDFVPKEPILMLGGDLDAGPVNHVFPISNATTEAYSAKEHLLSVSLVGDKCVATETDVRSQLASWFGDGAKRWDLLHRYDLEHALPGQPAGFRDGRESSIHIAQKNMVCCGDYVSDASVNGALRSGREAAEYVLAEAH